MDSRGTLDGLTVLEVGGHPTLYAGKLLADQGACVLLVEPPDGHPARRESPLLHSPGGEPASAVHQYMNASKNLVSLDISTVGGRAQLESLIQDVDLVLAGGRPRELRALGITPEGWETNTLVAVTPFGFSGPWADLHTDELIVNSLSGMMSLGGYFDDRPLQTPAGQGWAATGLFAAVASVAVLLEDAAARPTFVDVSAQECVMMGLENAAQYYDCEGLIRSRTGGRDTQVGRGVYACTDGFVFLMLGLAAGSKFWDGFLDWLDDCSIPGSRTLRQPRWLERSFRESDEAIAEFRRITQPFFDGQSKASLYAEARRRSIPLAPVNTIADLLTNEQLDARGFFVPALDAPIDSALEPGPPFRLSMSPWRASTRKSEWSGDSSQPTPNSSAPTEGSPRAASPRFADPQAQVPATTRPGPLLAGVRVLDFTWVGAGAYTTRLLGDLGAEIIKVESSTRVDQIRHSPPFADGVPGLNRSGYFADRNASKRGLALDLKHPEGRALALELAETADVVANNFSPGTMDRLGLGYDTLRALNPEMVYLEMSMQGYDGPHSHHVGYGLTIAALAGLHALVGDASRLPIGTGTNYPDHIPSPGHAAFAVICALLARKSTARGQRIEVSQVEATIAMLGPDVLAQQAEGDRPPQQNDRPGALLHDVLRTHGDDAWVAVSISTLEGWSAFVRVLGLPEDMAGPDVPHSEDAAHNLRRKLEQRTLTWDKWELMHALQDAGVKAGVVQNSQDLIEKDPQLRAREHWVRIPHPEAGSFLYNRLPFRIAERNVGPRSGAPLLGEHTDEILRALGRDEDEIERLRANGVFGDTGTANTGGGQR